MTLPEVEVQDLLNAQTGKIGWPELARHFARGVVIRVSSGQDLLEVAESLIQDRASDVENMYEQGLLRRALDDDAIGWQEKGSEFWAVVVAPWVLVQEI
jgi:hypothetical protein